MAKYSKKHLLSEKSKDEAMKIARGTQKPGQTKEQTKLIAQGIQKGIDIYKKKQSEKARELDKKLSKASALRESHETSTEQVLEPVVVKGNKLPWVLLALSWLGFVVYVVLVK
jgi:pyridoxine/pyridoxamine 5'-phosphate oxidase